jgi:urease accessory protein
MDAFSSSGSEASTPSTWVGKLDVSFAQVAGKTRVVHTEHRGPLRIMRPFYPEAHGAAHLYLLHPPGGVAGGDHLSIEIAANPQSHALITAPAANKLYRSAHRPSHVQARITASDDSVVEWLPQETIAFNGARADVSTIVRLEQGARFIGWEVTCLGRPAAEETFDEGELRQTFELWREETPLYMDRVRFGARCRTMQAPWGLSNGCVLGTLLIAHDEQLYAESVREVLATRGLLGRAAVTDLRGVTVLRYVGNKVSECWELFVRAWEVIRPVMLGYPAILPRIWSY